VLLDHFAFEAIFRHGSRFDGRVRPAARV
jgi:hypothetical protein